MICFYIAKHYTPRIPQPRRNAEPRRARTAPRLEAEPLTVRTTGRIRPQSPRSHLGATYRPNRALANGDRMARCFIYHLAKMAAIYAEMVAKNDRPSSRQLQKRDSNMPTPPRNHSKPNSDKNLPNRPRKNQRPRTPTRIRGAYNRRITPRRIRRDLSRSAPKHRTRSNSRATISGAHDYRPVWGGPAPNRAHGRVASNSLNSTNGLYRILPGF